MLAIPKLSVKISMKCHNYEAQPSRGTKRRTDEEHTMAKQKSHMKPSIHQQRRTEKPPWNRQKKNQFYLREISPLHILKQLQIINIFLVRKKVREKSRECHNHKPQPFPDPKRKRKPMNLNKHKPNKRTKSTKVSSLFPKRGNRNTKRTEKHKNKMTHGKTYNKSTRRINHKATRSNGR